METGRKRERSVKETMKRVFKVEEGMQEGYSCWLFGARDIPIQERNTPMG